MMFAKVHNHCGSCSSVIVGGESVRGSAYRTTSRTALDERHMTGVHFIRNMDSHYIYLVLN